MQYLDHYTTAQMCNVQRKAEDVAALAASGCDAGTLSLAISDLRDLVNNLAAAAREQRKVEARYK
jgi:hypothetical protein